eukprot:COSAG01_NODE_326_length_18790_cov_10.366005_10_plen_113_part_00
MVDTLWLNDNQIRKVEGLEALPKLRNVNLASNLIEHVDTAFDCCPLLEQINISDNLIGCFREIPNFGRLANLRSLQLNDTLFGQNPVVSLCNYQTYALFHVSLLGLSCPTRR